MSAPQNDRPFEMTVDISHLDPQPYFPPSRPRPHLAFGWSPSSAPIGAEDRGVLVDGMLMDRGPLVLGSGCEAAIAATASEDKKEMKAKVSYEDREKKKPNYR